MSRTRDFHKPDTACRDTFFEKLNVNSKSKKAYHGYGKHGTVFVHCHNHVVDSLAGEVFHDYPFDDNDKKQIMSLFKSILKKYRIEALSFCCMSNHFHALLVADNRKFSPKEMSKRYNSIHENSIKLKLKAPMNESSPQCKRMAEHSNDISHFMRDFQHAVTLYYNKKNKRKGTLWRGHFKSVLVEKSRALVNMISYIELNPVRAQIVVDPADYPFSFWGDWSQQGRHPFQRSFNKHLRHLLSKENNIHNKEELQFAFQQELKLQLSKSTKTLKSSLSQDQKKPVDKLAHAYTTLHSKAQTSKTLHDDPRGNTMNPLTKNTDP